MRRCPTFIERRVSDTVYEFKAIAATAAAGSSSDGMAPTTTTTSTTATATVITTTTTSSPRRSDDSGASRVVGRTFVCCVVGTALAVLVALLVLLVQQEWMVYPLGAVAAVGVASAAWSAVSQVTEESVLIIRDFGIQLQAKYVSGAEETTFLDKDRISGVIIHEYIRGASVRYGLAFLMRGDDAGGADHTEHQSACHAPQMPLSFGHVYPGLDNLTRVYRACAEMIHSSSAAAGSSHTGSLWEY